MLVYILKSLLILYNWWFGILEAWAQLSKSVVWSHPHHSCVFVGEQKSYQKLSRRTLTSVFFFRSNKWCPHQTMSHHNSNNGSHPSFTLTPSVFWPTLVLLHVALYGMVCLLLLGIVTINSSFKSIDLFVSSLSHIYKLNSRYIWNIVLRV